MTSLVLDSSAVAAMAFEEPGWRWIANNVTNAPATFIAAPTVVELGMVLEARHWPHWHGVAQRTIRRAGAEVVPFTSELADRALDAWRLYGKGRHPAALNLGDCFSYALAELTGLPLLCTGNDFAQTPLPILMPPAVSE